MCTNSGTVAWPPSSIYTVADHPNKAPWLVMLRGVPIAKCSHFAHTALHALQANGIKAVDVGYRAQGKPGTAILWMRMMDLEKISSKLAQDSCAWSATIHDLVNYIGSSSPSHYKYNRQLR